MRKKCSEKRRKKALLMKKKGGKKEQEGRKAERRRNTSGEEVEQTEEGNFAGKSSPLLCRFVQVRGRFSLEGSFGSWRGAKQRGKGQKQRGFSFFSLLGR